MTDSGSVLSYPRQLFARLLERLAHHGVPVVDLDWLLDPKTPEGVALTFDDGARSVLANALPVVCDHSAPAHLFLTTGVVGGHNRWPGQPAGAPRFAMLDWPEVLHLQARGFTVEGHTVTHPDLCAVDDVLRAYLARRFRHGRCFAARRHEQPSQPPRLVCLAFTPLLPLLRVLRAGRWARRERTLWRAFWRRLHLLLLAEGAWSLGEALGYALGPGTACADLD